MGDPVRESVKGQAEGFGLFRLNVKDGKRWSSAKAYLALAKSRPNLEIRSRVEVLRLTGDGPRIDGLRVMTPSGEEQLAAGHVVLSAGAIGTWASPPRRCARSASGCARTCPAWARTCTTSSR